MREKESDKPVLVPGRGFLANETFREIMLKFSYFTGIPSHVVQENTSHL